MQVYLPADLYARAKSRGEKFNVSGVLQAALEETLDELDRQDALARAVASFETDRGAFTATELAAQQKADETAARAVRPRRRRSTAA